MIYNFSNRLSCFCIMETIFNHRIEFVCCWGVLVIVYATLCIYIRNFLPNPTFTCTDGTDSFKQLLKVVLPKYSLSLLQPVIIKNKSLFNVFIQDFRSPLTETSSF